MFGNDVKSTNIPVEVWRYYLLINRPEVPSSLLCNRTLVHSEKFLESFIFCLFLLFMATNVPLQVSDTLFTWVDLQAKQNNELLKNLGNFVHRTLSFLAKPSGLNLQLLDYTRVSLSRGVCMCMCMCV